MEQAQAAAAFSLALQACTELCNIQVTILNITIHNPYSQENMKIKISTLQVFTESSQKWPFHLLFKQM